MTRNKWETAISSINASCLQHEIHNSLFQHRNLVILMYIQYNLNALMKVHAQILTESKNSRRDRKMTGRVLQSEAKDLDNQLCENRRQSIHMVRAKTYVY